MGTVFITLSRRLINVIVSQDLQACSVTELVSYVLYFLEENVSEWFLKGKS